MYSFQSLGGGLEQSKKHSQIIFYSFLPVSDWLDSLIGPGGLLSVVFYLIAILVSVLYWKKASR